VPASVQEFFDCLEGQFKSDKAVGLNAVYQFVITGEDGGEWSAAIADGRCTVTPGEHDNPNITITCGDEDWLKIVNGQLDSQMAFMTGKLKVKGDMGLAMRLQSIFF